MEFKIEAAPEGINTAAFRILENRSVVYYNSTRLGGVKVLQDGFLVEVPEEYIGKEYELKSLPSLQVISTGVLKFNTDEIHTEEEFAGN